MTDIASTNTPVQVEGARTRSPVSESLIQTIGGDINYLLAKNLKDVVFLASNTWLVPANVTEILIEGTGAGGGGGSGGGLGSTGGEGGKAGKYAIRRLAVTPGDTLTITIGAGGIGGTFSVNFQPGNAGGDTTVGSLSAGTLTWKGGQGGIADTSLTSGGVFGKGAIFAQDSISFARVAAAATAGDSGAYGQGTIGATTSTPAVNAGNNTGAGGGGGASSINSVGANGGSGKITIVYNA